MGKIDLESPHLMHAITQTGLETYTLKTSYSTVLEAEAMDNRTKSCPSTELTVCLVGLRPFLGKCLHISCILFTTLVNSKYTNLCIYYNSQ